MSNQRAPRMTVQGVRVLLLEQGPYIEVAERVRAVHKAGKIFGFERGEVLKIHDRWLYRTYITVGEQSYIGDAEIHFGAPSQTPDGTKLPVGRLRQSAMPSPSPVSARSRVFLRGLGCPWRVQRNFLSSRRMSNEVA
jgi:hypothetical protein